MRTPHTLTGAGGITLHFNTHSTQLPRTMTYAYSMQSLQHKYMEQSYMEKKKSTMHFLFSCTELKIYYLKNKNKSTLPDIERDRYNSIKDDGVG